MPVRRTTFNCSVEKSSNTVGLSMHCAHYYRLHSIFEALKMMFLVANLNKVIFNHPSLGKPLISICQEKW